MCFCMREFITWDESVFDSALYECEECEYKFGRSKDWTKEGVPEQDVLAPELVYDARAARNHEYRTSLLNSGVTREELRYNAKKRSK